jgi:hypothetical protein
MKEKNGAGLVSLGPSDRWNEETDQGANTVCPDEICQEGQVAKREHYSEEYSDIHVGQTQFNSCIEGPP